VRHRLEIALEHCEAALELEAFGSRPHSERKIPMIHMMREAALEAFSV
jgi:hypothetical protein